jgi:hypothetical protein
MGEKNLKIAFKINIEKLETTDLMPLTKSILFMNLDIL